MLCSNNIILSVVLKYPVTIAATKTSIAIRFRIGMVICELSFTSRDCCSFATFISRLIFWLFYFGVFYLAIFFGDRSRDLSLARKGSVYSDLHSGVGGWGGRPPLLSNVLNSLSFCLCLTKVERQSHTVIL